MAQRFFKTTSEWNLPLGNAPVDSRSASFINKLKTWTSFPKLVIGNWASPIYWSDAGDPLYTVQVRGGGNFGTPIHIPLGATPMQNSDGEMIIVDTVGAFIVSMHACQFSGGTWSVDFVPAIYYDSSNGLSRDLTESDDNRNDGHRGAPPAIHSVRWDEIQDGVINHVIKVALRETNGSDYPDPSKSGAERNYPMSNHEIRTGLIPEGMIARIKRSVDLPSMFSGAALVIARACQDYGVVIGDTGASGSMNIKLEGIEYEGQSYRWSDVGLSANSLNALTWDDWEFVQGGYHRAGGGAPTIVVSPATLPAGTEGTAYATQTFVGSGGTGPYDFALTSGTLPPGLALSGAHGQTLSGTPSAAGSYSFTITATDAQGFTGSRAYTVAIAAGTVITITPATLPHATKGTAYSKQLAASGGTGPYVWSVTAGALPTGITLSAGGLLAGTPSVSGLFTFTVRATDSLAAFGQRSYTLDVDAVIDISPTALPNGTEGTAYDAHTLAASGGVAPYTWAISAGSLPPGLSLSAGGLLDGTPTTLGSYQFTVEATDDNADTGTRQYTITVDQSLITITPSVLPVGDINQAYPSTPLTASGGTGPYTWTHDGTLPAGMSFTDATATFAGTPTESGAFTVTVFVVDANGVLGSRTYELAINSAVDISPAELPGGTLGEVYSETLVASGGTGPYTWAAVGDLPPGITFDDGTATFEGTPSAAGTYPDIEVTATDSTDDAFSRTFSFSISSGISAIPLLRASKHRFGTILHEVISPEGEADWPTIGEWAADESAPGGFGPASGKIRPERIRKKPEVYRAGSVWRSWLAETGTCIHGGELATPTVEGGVGLLSTKGWAVLPERQVDRLLYQARGIEPWSDARTGLQDQISAEQHGPLDHIDTTPGPVGDDPQVGMLNFNVPSTLQADYSFGCVVFSAPGQKLSRLAFSIIQDDVTWVSVRNDSFTIGNEGGPGFLTWIKLIDTGTDGHHFVVDLTKAASDTDGGQSGDTVQTGSVFVGVAPESTPVNWQVSLYNLRVNAIAPGDSFSASKLVQDIAARLGLETSGVQNGGFNVLPYDLVNGAYADGLDYASLLQDWPWLVVDLGTGPRVRFGPWDDRVWTVLSTRQPFSPLPQEQYDRIAVPYLLADGATVGMVRVRAAVPLAVSKTYGPLALQDPMPIDKETASTIGGQALELLRPLRYAGGMSLGIVKDEGGFPRSPFLVRAGQSIYHAPSSIKGLRVANVHKTYSGVDVRFAESLTGLDRLVERRSKRLKLAAGVS